MTAPLWNDPAVLWNDPAVRWDDPGPSTEIPVTGGDLKRATTLVGKILASGRIAGTGATTVYTVPSASSAVVATAVLCNVSSAAVTVSVSVVPAGGSVDTTRRVIPGFALAAGDSTRLVEIHRALLGAGTLISVTCSAGGAINYLLTGAVSA